MKAPRKERRMNQPTCAAHGVLEKAVATINGKLTIVLLLLVSLVGGTVYNNIKINTLERDQQAIISTHKYDRDNAYRRMDECNEAVDYLTVMCCSELN